MMCPDDQAPENIRFQEDVETLKKDHEGISKIHMAFDAGNHGSGLH